MKYCFYITFVLLLACTRPPADKILLQTLKKLPNLEKPWTASSEDTVDWEQQKHIKFKNHNLIAKAIEANAYYTILAVSNMAVDFTSDSLPPVTDSEKLLQLLTLTEMALK